MERLVNIDIQNSDDFIEKYNQNMVSRELLDYIISQAIFTSKKERIKLVIHPYCETNLDYVKLMREGFKREYQKNFHHHFYNNIKQFFLLLIGISFLFFSQLMKGESLFKELFLIIGWVPLWEAIELELFSDTEDRRKRRVLKRLLSSEISVSKH